MSDAKNISLKDAIDLILNSLNVKPNHPYHFLIVNRIVNRTNALTASSFQAFNDKINRFTPDYILASPFISIDGIESRLMESLVLFYDGKLYDPMTALMIRRVFLVQSMLDPVNYPLYQVDDYIRMIDELIKYQRSQ